METNLNKLEKAFMEASLPCNPLPFLNGIKEGVKRNGTDWIKSDQAKRILYVLIMQSYGQLFKIYSLKEYVRLSEDL